MAEEERPQPRQIEVRVLNSRPNRPPVEPQPDPSSGPDDDPFLNDLQSQIDPDAGDPVVQARRRSGHPGRQTAEAYQRAEEERRKLEEAENIARDPSKFDRVKGFVIDKYKNKKIFGKQAPSFIKHAFLSQDALLNIAIGAGIKTFLKVGVGATGIGGTGATILIGGAAGGIMGAYKELGNQARAEGKDLSGIRNNVKERFKKIPTSDKKKLAIAAGKGAAYGMVGAWVGAEIVDAIGGIKDHFSGGNEYVPKGTFAHAGELKDKVMSNFSTSTAYAAELDSVPLEQSLQSQPEGEFHIEDVPVVGGVKNAVGGLFHNTGLKAHEVTSALPIEEVPIIGGVKNAVGGLFHNTGLKAHEITSAVPIESVPVVGGVKNAVGGLFHNAGLKASEILHTTGKMPWDSRGSYIEPGKFSPKIDIPEDAPDWLKADNINSLNGEYAHHVQAAVGEGFQAKQDQIVRIAEEVARQQSKTLSLEDRYKIINDAMHTIEVAGNKSFDSHLEEIVKGSRSLDDLNNLGKADLDDWFKKDFDKDIAERVKIFYQTQGQIDSVLTDSNVLGPDMDIPSGKSIFEIQFSGKNPNDINQLKEITNQMVNRIAVNQDEILHAAASHWAQEQAAHPDQAVDFYFPAYLGELEYLREKALAGDVDSLYRLRDALSIKMPTPIKYKLINEDGIKKILDALKLMR
jgi:hypothetical protein